jgi:hypothetical protein
MTRCVSTHLLLKQLLVALLDLKSFEPIRATPGSNRITLMPSLIPVHLESVGLLVPVTYVCVRIIYAGLMFLGSLASTSSATSVLAQSPPDQSTTS